MDMRWTRPRRGKPPVWLEDSIRDDAWLVLAGTGAQPEEPYETDRFDGLALRLARATPDRAGMVQFTLRHGLLDDRRISDGRAGGSFADWLAARADARYLIAGWFGDAPDIPHDPALRAEFTS